MQWAGRGRPYPWGENRAVEVLGDVSDDSWFMPAADAASSGQDLGGRRAEAEERLTRWAEAEDREIDPGRGTSGFAFPISLKGSAA